MSDRKEFFDGLFRRALAKRNLKFKRLRPEAILPKYQTKGSACFDLHAVVNEDNPCFTKAVVPYAKPENDMLLFANMEEQPCLAIQPGGRCTVPTGWAVEVPIGYEMQIRPRSGLAAKYGITVLNAPGTIDSDYRGEVCVILLNTDRHMPLVIRTGDRIAQGKKEQAMQDNIEETKDLAETERGTGGFGSTGV